MRIAVIAPPWAPIPPKLYGGIELVVDELATGFQQAGHEVVLFATGDSASAVTTRWVLEQAEGHRIGAAVPELRHVMNAYDAVGDFDVVHDHTIIGPVYSERYPDVRVVTTVHGPFNEELADIYRRIAERVPIIAISHAQRRHVADLRIARVIHHGVDPHMFPVGAGDGGYFLFLGRMAPEKGAHRAVEAARKAGVPLLVAAKMRESREVEYFDTLVKPSLNEDVVYLGEVEHEEKVRLLAGARALLNPIRWAEPFGLVMVESLACGTPVLAFPEGAAPEIVEDGRTGFLCHDEVDMAERIGQVDQLDRTACRASVTEYFNTTRMVNEHLALFEDLICAH
ncbi:MAG TPA: glycosyltransferase family 4 protein [Acidimicrobiales bacterium]|nr:glycosyltransferase family 4 protein [Acidimicrobiales bacterium]